MLARAREGATTGEVNREWNGITTKAWAQIARDMTEGALADDQPVAVYPGSPTISHFDLLETARRVFGWQTETVWSSRRFWKAATPTVMLPSIEEQLRQF